VLGGGRPGLPRRPRGPPLRPTGSTPRSTRRAALGGHRARHRVGPRGRSLACPLAVAASAAGFFERENCGQCPPCAVGTARLSAILRAVEAGTSRPRDLRDLGEVAGFMSGHGYCAHGRTAAAVARGRRGPSRRRSGARRRRPLPGGRHPDPFAPGSPERAAVLSAGRGAAAMRFPMRNDLIVLILATIVSYPLGLALKQPWLLPVLNALPAYVVLVHRLRKGERGGAVRAMLWWAATVAIVARSSSSGGRSRSAGSSSTPGVQGRDVRWIRTGRGSEATSASSCPSTSSTWGLPRRGPRHGQRRRDPDGRRAHELHVVLRGRAGQGRGAGLGGHAPRLAAVGHRQGGGLRDAGGAPRRAADLPGLPLREGEAQGHHPPGLHRAAMSGILADWFLKFLLAPTWGRWLRSLLP